MAFSIKIVQFLITVIQFIVGLLIIVGIHELGHLLLAKLFNMRVNNYIIGFPPKIFKFKFGETEYALGAVPLGGAVQIAGMVDESLDENNLADTPQPWEFRSKPAWQRLIVILGGIIFNLLSGIIIYIGLAYAIGSYCLPKNEVNTYGIMPYGIGIEMGFKEGDKIVKINGKDFNNFYNIFAPNILLSDKSYYTIQRDNQELDIPIPSNFIDRLSENKTKNHIFVEPIYLCIMDIISPNSTVDQAGLVSGDQIVELDNQPALYRHQLVQIAENCSNKTVQIAYLRKGTKMISSIQLDNIGQRLDAMLLKPAPEIVKYSFLQSIPVGLNQAALIIGSQALGIWKLITGKISVSKSLGGPISIAKSFGSEFIWSKFWLQVANLSIVIALMNLIPLPALDGGHALFILYEMLLRRKPSERFLQTAQKMGMILLLFIMVYAFGNDIRKILVALL